MISLGFIVGIIVTVILSLGCIGMAIYAFHEDEPGIGRGLLLGLVVVLGLSAWGFFPYKMEYHSYKPVSGKIKSIDKRLVSSGDGMQDKFVVRYEGNSQQYGCTDTRCASIKKGDELRLMCMRVWEYAGTDGYDCKYGQ